MSKDELVRAIKVAHEEFHKKWSAAKAEGDCLGRSAQSWLAMGRPADALEDAYKALAALARADAYADAMGALVDVIAKAKEVAT